MTYTSTPSEEKLFLNTLTFDYPVEPVTMYFSDHDVPEISLCPLTNLFPVGIEQIFPSLAPGTTIYTSFTRSVEGFLPLPVDFHNEENFFLVKRFYNREIQHYFRTRNLLVDVNFIKDTDVYVYDNTETFDNYDFDVFNRFHIKVNFNEVLHKPELVVSYGRSVRIMRMSFADFMQSYATTNNSVFGSSNAVTPSSMVVKTLHKKPLPQPGQYHQRIVNLRKLLEDNKRHPAKATPVDYSQHHIIINRQLRSYFHIADPSEQNSFERPNRYTRFLPLITDFIKRFMSNDAFRNIVPFAHNFTPVEAGHLPPAAMQLTFANNTDNRVPQRGLNAGPYRQPNYYNIYLFFIMPNEERASAEKILNYLTNGYGEGFTRYDGLLKYLGIPFQTMPRLSFMYNSASDNCIAEIDAEIAKRSEQFAQDDAVFLCLYLSPISKRLEDPEKHEQYYHIKESLLRHNVVSQCIDLAKLKEQLDKDELSKLKYPDRPRYNFAYSLQNISVAINAKLGGQPWVISVPQQREFVIGIGAFHSAESRKPYIGAAFVFNNIGAFNKYTYFEQDRLSLLVGAIEEEIGNYRRTFDNPSRIIIHYYKVMREKDSRLIEDMLERLQLDIPFYVVTINETESEDVFVFDEAYQQRMPYSGRYVSLGSNTYLLCNNTRYENSDPKPGDGYPFPVKIRLSCHGINMLPQSDIQHLITQVYQFSRIYWKSVRQQNLPVTIMYPKMIAEIMPHFRRQGVTHHIPSDRLWFL